MLCWSGDYSSVGGRRGAQVHCARSVGNNMGGCLARLLGRGSAQQGTAYKKVEARSIDDVEAGGRLTAAAEDDNDDEEWDDFGTQASGAVPPPVGTSQSSPAIGAPPQMAEPEPEPEPDPFAGFDMAPTIKATKRHVAQSAFAKPAPASGRISSLLAAEDDDASGAGGGWGISDDDLDFGVSERRKAAVRLAHAMLNVYPPAELPRPSSSSCTLYPPVDTDAPPIARLAGGAAAAAAARAWGEGDGCSSEWAQSSRRH